MFMIVLRLHVLTTNQHVKQVGTHKRLRKHRTMNGTV